MIVTSARLIPNVVASNGSGSTTSALAQLQVVSGPPIIVTDVPAVTYVYAGRSMSIGVTVARAAVKSTRPSSSPNTL